MRAAVIYMHESYKSAPHFLREPNGSFHRICKNVHESFKVVLLGVCLADSIESAHKSCMRSLYCLRKLPDQCCSLRVSQKTKNVSGDTFFNCVATDKKQVM